MNDGGKRIDFYRNIIGGYWFFSSVLYYYAFLGVGFTETVSKIVACVLWIITAFPVAKIVNLLSELKKRG